MFRIIKIKILICLCLFFLFTDIILGNTRFSNEEFSINFFRAPSIGGEYRKGQYSVHGGYYVTNFDPGITTEFYKLGIGYWFLPMDLGSDSNQPSSFYTYLSYGKGVNLEYQKKYTVMVELGYRFMIGRGFSFRFGLIVLAAEGSPTELNPTPSISYSEFF
ncbi:hypothetical protein LPTSP2_16720 [Leptospira ellinghausenii]|uniref:Uncharacterized protein n=1 Tax=Leptospira ellinghausenii TaxID=1917822 RepID=A0A2P2DCR0_9LEPT|nr:hypothetical protein [Leptospira ellinghausenii]GBF42385.1 hypothetical protein LPTSP2_16720 [Leptospira ellinghausenii]